ncbi:xylulose kinase [Schizosaccharomyces cryophilus OY26]|uniref:Xylulose kinase n=1 Tax=Schizosaccharomyces cryophilus (strain OY26 / ATCC MYA-4695 / CBS 11777 / NBRC 106824 / NRRL Y48691) TaxID=653667 RepID=S9VUY6_SCHCR|nr:xylulose kinase [Schizosaccharomyces cryophilus OY26]EPY49860.1 xylulose kinase [Schizosaccharomyces cryophilus OY26]
MFLGLDLSTQQLKGVTINEKLDIVQEVVVDFDKDFPSYNTTKGVYKHGHEVVAPVAMWLDAIDLLCARLAKIMDVSEIQGICGAGQQHAGVFWLEGAERALGSLETNSTLKSQLEKYLYSSSPNWQDATTSRECREMEAVVGGPDKLADLTGSKAHLRFTGPQIKRFRRLHPDIYEKTERIGLASSFLMSVFLQREAPLEISDVCGMNLWDIQNEQFDSRLLDDVAGPFQGSDLAIKLGSVEMNGAKQLGRIGSYFSEKYGFSSHCQIIPITGDNPATLLSLPLRPGKDVLLSLGTSTTALMATSNYVCSPEYHMFGHPIVTNHFMVMLCYKNGSLARETVRDSINEKYQVQDKSSWELFNEFTLKERMDSRSFPDQKIGLYYPLREIIPAVGPGAWRFNIRNDKLEPVTESSESWTSPDDDARAIVESQFLDIRNRITPLLTDVSRPQRVYVVGGASRNEAIVQMISEILGCDVYRLKQGASNACAIGGAVKAAYAMNQQNLSFDEFVQQSWDENKKIELIRSMPEKSIYDIYGRLLPYLAEAQEIAVHQSEQDDK